MKTKQKKGSPSVLIVLLVAILLVVSGTFAWIYRESESVSRLFKVSNFSAVSVVTFVQADPPTTANDIVKGDKYSNDYGFLVSLDPRDENYLGKLRVKIRYKGAGTGLLRVRVVEEWSTLINGERVIDGKNERMPVKRIVQPYQLEMPYTIASTYSGNGSNQSAWLDNRKTDYCFYYAAPIYSTGTSEIELFSGVDTSGLDLGVLPGGTQLHILIETDAVQVNRYPQYWNMTRLPWTASNSGVTTGIAPGDDVAVPTTAAQQQTP